MPIEYVLSRAGVPVIADGAERKDLDWDWAVAWPFAALASPRSAARMPALPNVHNGELRSAALGYWNCLAYLLTYSLGWSRHDRGLRWWYDAGKPTDDPRLALVSAVWERDGSLDRYLEWSHSQPFHVPADFVDAAAFNEGPVGQDALSRGWQVRLEQIRLSSQASHGHLSDAQPHGFHLESGTHIQRPLSPATFPARVLIDSEDLLEAVLIVPTLSGWYDSLRKAGANLIESNGNSQRVSVYANSDGYLGTYRRSWQTGIWFAGKHRYHAAGN